MGKVMILTECPECGSTSFSGNERDRYCTSCGLVVDEEAVDRSPEYRAYSLGEEETRKRAENSHSWGRKGQGFHTRIGKGPSSLSKVPGSRRPRMKRMMKWNRRSSNQMDRSVRQVVWRIREMCSELQLPDHVREECCRMFIKCRSEGVVQGRKKDVVAAALVYIVARQMECPRALDEVTEFVDEDKHKLGQTYKYVVREMDIGLEPIDPVDLCSRYLSRMDLMELEPECRSTIRYLRDQGVTAGRSPKSILAGVIYHVAGAKESDRVTQRGVAEALGVTNVTVRKVWQDFKQTLPEEGMVEAQ